MDQSDRHKHADDHPAVLTETEATQGSGRQMNLRVLLMALALVVAAGLAIGASFYWPA